MLIPTTHPHLCLSFDLSTEVFRPFTLHSSQPELYTMPHPTNQLNLPRSIDRPPAPVWDVFEYFLGHQVRQTRSLCKPAIDLDDEDLADILHSLTLNLTHGGNQKQIMETFAPCLESRQQHAVFSELCSWIFSTQGVLSSLYQPLLSECAALGNRDNMEGIVTPAAQCKYRHNFSGFTKRDLYSN